MGWGRWRLLLVGALVLAVVGTTAWLVLPPRQTDDVALPADDATPEEVVTAFLDAIEAHDCDTAEALTSWDRSFDPEPWCTGVRDIADRRIGDPTRERPGWSGRSPGEEVANVATSFVLTWRPFRGDPSTDVGGGRFHWGYLLVRSSSNDPWRIYGQGAG